MAECGRGWANRCRVATGKKCTCKCGGVNHGADLSETMRDALFSKLEADFTIEYDGPEGLVLRDTDKGELSVTNDAENVVQRVKGKLRGRRLFYFDTMGQLDEMVVVDNVFLTFRPGAPDEVKAALERMAVAA